MLVSKIKAVSVHYRPLPPDAIVVFFLSVIVVPPFEKYIARGVYTDKYGIGNNVITYQVFLKNSIISS